MSTAQSSGIEASIFRLLHLLVILLILLQSLSSYNVLVSAQEQDGAVERNRQQRQQQQRQQYLNRVYLEKYERGEEDDLDKVWKDLDNADLSSTPASSRRVKVGNPNREESSHPWDDVNGGGLGDEDKDKSKDEDQYAYGVDEDEEDEKEEELLQEIEGKDDMSNMADPEATENKDSSKNDNGEGDSEDIKADRVVLADIRTILEVNVRKEQQGFLPQKVLVLLNEMVNGTEVEEEEEEEEEKEGTGGEQILRQHLCWAFLDEEGDIWPDHEYPCYEWHKSRRGSLYDGLQKDFRAAMSFIDRLSNGKRSAEQTYTMRLGKYWSIGNMYVFVKRPGGTFKMDWSTGVRIRDIVECTAVKGFECNMRPDIEGRELIWRAPRGRKST